MGFPSEKELKAIRPKLEKAEPSRLLSKDASKADKVKYKLCEKFVIYLLDHKMSQTQLVKKLKVDPSRVNEITKYRIELYTVDKLMDLAERLEVPGWTPTHYAVSGMGSVATLQENRILL